MLSERILTHINEINLSFIFTCITSHRLAHVTDLGYRRQQRVAAMETQFKGMRDGAPDVLDLDKAPTVGGGVGDTFGEDAATEDQTLTPWTRVVAR